MSAAQAVSSLPGSTFSSPHLTGSKLQAKTGPSVAEMAKDFEAMFLSLLLKEMRQGLEPGGLFPGDTGDVQGGLFDLYMSKHLADGGGVGLAAALGRQFHQDATADVLKPAPAVRSLPGASGA